MQYCLAVCIIIITFSISLSVPFAVLMNPEVDLGVVDPGVSILSNITAIEKHCWVDTGTNISKLSC